MGGRGIEKSQCPIKLSHAEGRVSLVSFDGWLKMFSE